MSVRRCDVIGDIATELAVAIMTALVGGVLAAWAVLRVVMWVIGGEVTP